MGPTVCPETSVTNHHFTLRDIAEESHISPCRSLEALQKEPILFIIFKWCIPLCFIWSIYRGAHKSLARPGREQIRKHVRDAHDFNNIETRTVIKFFFSYKAKAPKEIHAILTETLACFLPGRAKDLSAPLCVVYNYKNILIHNSLFIRIISCISSYIFRLVYRAIFRPVFRVVCM